MEKMEEYSKNRVGETTRNVWSRARMASKRNEVECAKEREKMKIKHREITLENKNGKSIMRTVQNSMRMDRSK